MFPNENTTFLLFIILFLFLAVQGWKAKPHACQANAQSAIHMPNRKYSSFQSGVRFMFVFSSKPLNLNVLLEDGLKTIEDTVLLKIMSSILFHSRNFIELSLTFAFLKLSDTLQH